MTPAINALLASPPAAAAIISALTAAAIAVLVAAATQYLTFKKSRTESLTPKLEQLYLLVNELSEQNATDFRQLYRSLQGDVAAATALQERDNLDLYGHRRAKKIIMLIRLYFPELSRAHQMVFAAERELNDLKHDLQTEDPPTPDELVAASGRIGHFLMLMEQELIQNRDRLLHANLLPRSYRFVTPEQIAAERPPPAGSPFSAGAIRKRG